jgi:uncharacterized delta-60 repeat protein
VWGHGTPSKGSSFGGNATPFDSTRQTWAGAGRNTVQTMAPAAIGGMSGIFNFVINGVDWQEALSIKQQSTGKYIVVGTMNFNTGTQWNPDVALSSPPAHFLPYALRLNKDGTLDQTFGAGGFINIDFPAVSTNLDSEATDIAILSDDSILLPFIYFNGTFSGLGTGRNCIAKLTKNGLIDSTFGTNGVVLIDRPNQPGFYADIVKVGVQSNNNIVLLGPLGFSGEGTNAYSLTPSGAQNTGWGNSSSYIFAPGFQDVNYLTVDPRTLLIQSDDKPILGMIYGSDQTSQQFGICRATSGGTADTAFGTIDATALVNNPIGIGATTPYAGILQEPGTGKLIVGGWSVDVSGNASITLFRLNAADGSLDTSFGTSGITASHLGSNVYDQTFSGAMFYDHNGRIVIGGTTGTTDPGSGYHIPNFLFMITRYTANGLVDKTFNFTGVKQIDITGQGALDNQTVYGGFCDNASGQYVFCGHYNSAQNHGHLHTGGGAKLWVLRTDTSGNPDTFFGLSGFASQAGPTVTTSAVSAIGTVTATANASITPNTTSTKWVFQYGAASGLYSTQTQAVSASSGANSVGLTGLLSGHTYFGRAVAWNSVGDGITHGAEVTWTQL